MVLLSTARGRRQRYVPLRRIEVSRGAHDCFVLPGIVSRKNWECPWSWSAIHSYGATYNRYCKGIFVFSIFHIFFIEMLHIFNKFPKNHTNNHEELDSIDHVGLPLPSHIGRVAKGVEPRDYHEWFTRIWGAFDQYQFWYRQDQEKKEKEEEKKQSKRKQRQQSVSSCGYGFFASP